MIVKDYPSFYEFMINKFIHINTSKYLFVASYSEYKDLYCKGYIGNDNISRNHYTTKELISIIQGNELNKNLYKKIKIKYPEELF